ncbi:hypothetical protein Tco_1368939 [Tanacetum coccineum]
MSWFSRCSWCGGPFNGGNCQRCTNVSFGDEFVNNPEPVLNDETPDFSYPPSQPQTSSLDQWHCLSEGFCFICASSNENSSNNDLNSNSFNDPPNDFTYPPQPHNIFPHEEISIRVLLAKERILKLIQVWDEKQIKPWSLPELLLQFSNDPRTIAKMLKQREEKRIEREQAANLAVQKEQEEQAAQSFTPYWNFPMIDDDDEYTIQYREYLERSSKAITSDLPTEEPDNSLSMGDGHLNTIPEIESDKLIKSSVENLVPIPSESKGISEDICDVPFNDFDEEKGAIDIDILQIEDEILREKLLNVNLLIDKIEALNLTPSIPFVLEYPSSSSILVVDSDFLIEEVDTFLVSEDSIPPGIESDFDLEGDIIFDDLLNDDPIPEYERFTFDIEPDMAMINNFDELNEDECFDPGGGEIVFSQNVEDDDSFTFVIRTFLPFVTYPEDSSLPLSSGNEDTIFDPGISAFLFFSFKPAAFKCPMKVCSSTCFVPNITMIWGE